jgi:hypothetical protein
MSELVVKERHARYIEAKPANLVGWRNPQRGHDDLERLLSVREGRGDAPLTDAFFEYVPDVGEREKYVSGGLAMIAAIVNSPDALQLMSSVLSHETARAESEELVSTINSLNGLLKARAFAILDWIFANADLSRARASTLIALLRTTYAARAKLRSWSTLLSRVRAELQRRGLEHDRLLRGL